MRDLIDRKEAINTLRAMQTYKIGAGDEMLLIDQAQAMTELMLLPSAEPKRGKWLPENRTIDAFWVCSSCGFPSEAHAANILYKYCPNCGAEMKGEQDEH